MYAAALMVNTFADGGIALYNNRIHVDGRETGKWFKDYRKKDDA